MACMIGAYQTGPITPKRLSFAKMGRIAFKNEGGHP